AWPPGRVGLRTCKGYEHAPGKRNHRASAGTGTPPGNALLRALLRVAARPSASQPRAAARRRASCCRPARGLHELLGDPLRARYGGTDHHSEGSEVEGPPDVIRICVASFGEEWNPKARGELVDELKIRSVRVGGAVGVTRQ